MAAKLEHPFPREEGDKDWSNCDEKKKRQRGGEWKERLGEITLDSIKEHVALLRGRISGRVLRNDSKPYK